MVIKNCFWPKISVAGHPRLKKTEKMQLQVLVLLKDTKQAEHSLVYGYTRQMGG